MLSQDLLKIDKTLILRWNQTFFKILFHIGIHAPRWSNQLFQWALMCIHVQYACIKLETNFQTKLNISPPSVSKNTAKMSFEVNIYDCNLYLWQRFQYLTERDKHVGPNILRKYSGEIFGENMQERGHFLKTKNPLENMWEISGVEFRWGGYYNILVLFLSSPHFVQIVYLALLKAALR